MLVQEQSGNITYDITGFKKLMICDDLVELRELEIVENAALFSIRVSFQTEGDGKEGQVLGRYGDYQAAIQAYELLLNAIISGAEFFSMVPKRDREIGELEQ